MNEKIRRPPLDTVAEISELYERGMNLSLDLLQSFGATSMSTMNRLMPSSTRDRLKPMFSMRVAPGTGSSCDIPPPCWAPQPIGEIMCHVCPGGTAIVRLRVTNCGLRPRDIKFEAAGKTAGLKIDPPNLALGPMERDYVSVSFPVPADAATGQEYEAVIWVHGCQHHYLRWIVKIASRGASCCHEVEVEDCPDLVHHWYDHFYCVRPCLD